MIRKTTKKNIYLLWFLVMMFVSTIVGAEWEVNLIASYSGKDLDMGKPISSYSLSCNVDLKNNPKFSGTYTCEYIGGIRATEGCYVDGKKEGYWHEWHPNGIKRYGAGYVSGDPITELFSYDIKGDLAIRAYPVISDETRQLVFSKNRIKKETCYCGSAKQIQRLEGACIDFIK
ncbi:MAG TPA: hypothetical protein EYQ45_07575, partial [Flavobacteriaceae bacterium]|nr:hypothetical protein [Flavobacteriaceae bacterium]